MDLEKRTFFLFFAFLITFFIFNKGNKKEREGAEGAEAPQVWRVLFCFLFCFVFAKNHLDVGGSLLPSSRYGRKILGFSGCLGGKNLGFPKSHGCKKMTSAAEGGGKFWLFFWCKIKISVGK